MVAAMVEVVGEEGKEGVVLTLLLLEDPVHPLQHLLTSETSETGWVFCRAA